MKKSDPKSTTSSGNKRNSNNFFRKEEGRAFFSNEQENSSITPFFSHNSSESNNSSFFFTPIIQRQSDTNETIEEESLEPDEISSGRLELRKIAAPGSPKVQLKAKKIVAISYKMDFPEIGVDTWKMTYEDGSEETHAYIAKSGRALFTPPGYYQITGIETASENEIICKTTIGILITATSTFVESFLISDYPISFHVIGTVIEDGVSDEDRKFLDRILKEVFPKTENTVDALKNLRRQISKEDVEALKFLDTHPDKDKIIQMIQQSRVSGNMPGKDIPIANMIELAIAQIELEKVAELPGLDIDFSDEAEEEGEISPMTRPIHGYIVNRSCPYDPANPESANCLVPGMEGRFQFMPTDNRRMFPFFDIAFTAIQRKPESDTIKEIDSERLSYIDIDDDSIINDKIFEVTFDEPGTYEVHGVVKATGYPGLAPFMLPVIVKTKEERLNELSDAAAAQEGSSAFGQLDESTRETGYVFEDVEDEHDAAMIGVGLMTSPAAAVIALTNLGSDDSEHAKGERVEGTLSDEIFKDGKGNFENSTRKLDEQIKILDNLIKRNKDKGSSADIVKWAEGRKKEIEELKEKLNKLQNKRGTKPVAVQAFYVTETPGVRSGELNLVCWFNEEKDGDETNIKATLYDHSELVRTEHFTFQADGADYHEVMEDLFFYLSSTYPNGRMRFSYQVYDDGTPTKKFIQVERNTNTTLNDIQNTVFSPEVSIAVNIMATILSVFPPTAPIGIGISLVYNGLDTGLNFMDAQRSGTVQASNYIDVGLLALDIIPFLGKAVKLTTKSGKVIRMLNTAENLAIIPEIAQFAGNVYMFTEGAFLQINELRDGMIVELAKIEQDIQDINSTASKQDPEAADKITRLQQQRDNLEKDIRSAAVDVFMEMGMQQGLQLATQSLAKKMAESYRGRNKTSPAADYDPNFDYSFDYGDANSPKRRQKNQEEFESNNLMERDAEAFSGQSTSTKTNTDPGLSQGLPANLRNEVPVSKDKAIHGDGVTVEYDVQNGVISNIRVLAGELATAENIRLHANTVRLLHRYSGFSGRVHLMLLRLNNLLAEYTAKFKEKPEPGTKAFEAMAEVEKLPAIIEAKAQKLADPKLDQETAFQLQRDLEDLESQLAQHEKALEEMSFELGEGSISAKGRTRIQENNADAVAAGYPDLETDSSPAPGYYYRERPVDSKNFELVAYSDTDASLRNKRLKRDADGKIIIETIPEGERKKTANERHEEFKKENKYKYGEPIEGLSMLEVEFEQRKFTDADKGTVRRWGEILKAIYEEGGDQKNTLIRQILDELKQPDFTAEQYKKFRREIRKIVVDQIVKSSDGQVRSSADQIAKLREFLGKLPEGDERSKGELLSAFRRSLQKDSGSGAERLSYMTELTDVSTQITPSTENQRAFGDGVVEITEDQSASGGPPEGTFLFEDKAGESFKKSQAENYSDQLGSEDGLVNKDGFKFDGLVYIFENKTTAISKKRSMDGLHPNIYIGYFADDGTIVWKPR